MIKIKFYTVDAGWISGEIITDEKNKYFIYSWITNFLNDLLTAILGVGGYIEDGKFGKFMTYVEPVIEDWQLTKKENDLIISINCFKDETRKTHLETTKIKCNYLEFVKGIFAGLTEMLKKIGLYGYRIEWENEFPLSLYLKLYEIIYNTKFLDLKERSFEETYGRGGEASNIAQELILLNNILK